MQADTALESIPLNLVELAASDLPTMRELERLAVPLIEQAASPQHLNVDPEHVRKGLGQLVLTLVKILHEVLERQAIRRMDAGSLTDAQIEALGTTLMLQAREIERLTREFGLEPSDLNLDLGPLGRLL